MTLCLLLSEPFLDRTALQVTQSLPIGNVRSVRSSKELTVALSEEPHDVVLASWSLIASAGPETVELLADVQFVLALTENELRNDILSRTSEVGSPSDFLVYSEGDSSESFAREAIVRIANAFRRTQLSTHERQQQEAITRSLQEIVYRLDEDGRFVYLNDAIMQIGYEPEDLLGRHFSELIDPEVVPLVSREHVLPALAGSSTGAENSPKLFDERRRGERRTVGLEVVLQGAGRLSESQFVGLVTASGDIVMELDGSATVVGTVGVIRDISADARASDSLGKLYTIADTAPYGIIVTDANLSIDYANPALYRTLGILPLDLMGASFGDIQSSSEWAGLAQELPQAMSTQTIIDRTIEVAIARGSRSEFRFTARPVYGATGECTGTVISLVEASLVEPEQDRTAGAVGQTLLEVIPELFHDVADRVTVGVSGEVPSNELVSRVARLVRIVFDFADVVVPGGSATVSVYASSDSVRLDLECTAIDGRSRAVADPAQVERISDALERERELVVREGGRWEVSRAEDSVSFGIDLPAERDRERVGAPAATSPMDLRTDPAGAPGQNQSPVDVDSGFSYHLFAAAYSDSPDVLEEIVSIYLEEVPERITTIEEALSPINFAAIVKAAHSLANTSGTLQAERALDAARELETAARAADEPRVQAAVDKLLPLIRSMLDLMQRAE